MPHRAASALMPLRASAMSRYRLLASLSLPRRYYSVRAAQGGPAVATVSDLVSLRPQDGDDAGLQVQVDGWVRNIRKSSAVRFVDVTDGSTSVPMQAVIRKDLAKDMQFGAAVRLKGRWKCREPQRSTEQTSDAARSPPPAASTKPAELQVDEAEILGPSTASTYPIQKKYATPESLRSIPHLRMRTPLNSTMLRLRSDTLSVLNQFFAESKFQQTHPPIITSSDCEGAGETFRVEGGTSKDPFSETEQYLTVSSQLHLEAFAQAIGNVWTLSPTFRAERSDTSRHLSEFYMLEAEMGFVEDMDEVMDFIQQMLKSVAGGLSERSAWKELDSFRLHPRDPAERRAVEDLDDRGRLEKRWNGLLTPERWPRITYTEAIDMLQEKADLFGFAPTWGKPLQSEHEKYLAETVGSDSSGNAHMPVFVTHYPRAIKAFYMRQAAENPSQGSVFDCFDLIVPDLGELAGGSMREHRLDALTANMDAVLGPKSGSHAALDWYVDLRRWGSPPHGGFGIGFDRLLSYLTGVKSIRDIVAFPRLYGHIHC